MSKEAAERFVTAWDAREPEVAKAVEAVPQTSFDLEALTSIAVSLGYEVEAAEIAEQLQLQREQALMQANASVVSVEELEQVVGGLCEDPCADTYDTYATCWVMDRCVRALNLYRFKSNCNSTHENAWDENCYTVDSCNVILLRYDND